MKNNEELEFKMPKLRARTYFLIAVFGPLIGHLMWYWGIIPSDTGAMIAVTWVAFL